MSSLSTSSITYTREGTRDSGRVLEHQLRRPLAPAQYTVHHQGGPRVLPCPSPQSNKLLPTPEGPTGSKAPGQVTSHQGPSTETEGG